MKVPETPGYYWCRYTTNDVWYVIYVDRHHVTHRLSGYEDPREIFEYNYPDAEFSWRLLSPAEMKQEIHQNGELHKEILRLKAIIEEQDIRTDE